MPCYVDTATAAMPANITEVGIIILSGGQGSRMGGVDKGLCIYQQTTLIEQVLAQLSKQYRQLRRTDSKQKKNGGRFAPDVLPIFISANRNIGFYEQLGQPVISDIYNDFCGPLAGIDSVINAYQQGWLGSHHNKITRWITYPVDSPLVPENYLQTMLALTPEQIGVWHAGARDHYANLSMAHTAVGSLRDYLQQGHRSIRGWLESSECALQAVGQSTNNNRSAKDSNAINSFVNLNYQADLAIKA
ncbi:NTP transferase domain-containing protein [Thiomicrorhabdus sediminis]|uniref:MobA-like NTP transferase domain-containing protein n=1 Tax=Thiomicrorhabdus sediminis TaxID=2580412 RepID=A0A4P9K5T5_9GAMM|nr:NTP transferase domain-containing protein [Thiomicrorhabdus sediminis]QCU90228.1 hypothetical protein FE785_06090 [Thiomicrorhabdus sediminis]